MAKALQLGDQTGVMINEVVEDSPAAKAGLEDGDVISFGEESLHVLHTLAAGLEQIHAAGEEFTWTASWSISSTGDDRPPPTAAN